MKNPWKIRRPGLSILTGTGIVGLNYTHAEAKKIGVKRARVLHRVFCAMTGLGIAAHVIGVKRPRH